MPGPKKKVVLKNTPLRNAEIKAIKAGAKAAKAPTSLSKVARNSMQLNTEYNQGFISGKQDMAAFKRNQAKQTIKKMGKKK